MFIALAKKELQALARDVHGLAALFLMPMVFIIVMSMALKDVYTPKVQALRYGVINQDGSGPSHALLQAWSKEHGAAVTIPAPAEWERDVHSGALKYVLRIDAGFAQSLDNLEDGADAQKVHLHVEPGLDQGLFESTRASLMLQVARLRTQHLLTQLRLDGDMASASDALFSQNLVSAQRNGSHVRPTSVQQSVPGWLVFGMFFVVAAIAGLFVEERSCGALARLRSLGAPPTALLAAKVAPYMLVNCVQAALMIAVGTWLMPLLGGDGLVLQGIDWLALIVVILSISAAAVSLALAIACLVRTHAQAATLGPILNVLMAALGGIMVPLFVMPEVMQHIASFSPMNWGLEALLDVFLRGANVSAVLPRVALLAIFAALMLGCAYALMRRS